MHVSSDAMNKKFLSSVLWTVTKSESVACYCLEM